MANSESINGNTDMVDNEITQKILGNIIIDAISTIHRKKRPDVNSIFEYLNKKLHNSNITFTLNDTRLSNLTIDGKLEIKCPLGKATYLVNFHDGGCYHIETSP